MAQALTQQHQQQHLLQQEKGQQLWRSPWQCQRRLWRLLLLCLWRQQRQQQQHQQSVLHHEAVRLQPHLDDDYDVCLSVHRTSVAVLHCTSAADAARCH
jgi:hypothetical protein